MFRFSWKVFLRKAITRYQTPERKGAAGEQKIHKVLINGLDENTYCVLSDIIVPRSNGTTQIDHIILSEYGIFIIETKNMTGWIFGTAENALWTQVLHRKRTSFQNPIRQNYGHLKAIQKILNISEKHIYNLVLFIGTATPKTTFPNNVIWDIRDLGKQIGSKTEVVFHKDDVSRFKDVILENHLGNSTEIQNQHINNIKTTQSVKWQTLKNEITCDRCGGKMVVRTNRKNGNKFYGCTRFPKCKSTKLLNTPTDPA